MAVTAEALLLRYADVGVATYASLRVVGRAEATVTWVMDEAAMGTVRDLLADALPDPRPQESTADAVQRAVTAGSFASHAAEQHLAQVLGETLMPEQAWRLLVDRAAEPGAVLFAAPTARLAQVPWSILAMPADGRRLIELVESCSPHRPTSRTRRVGRRRGAPSARRCSSSTRGCPASDPTRRSARYWAGRHPRTR